MSITAIMENSVSLIEKSKRRRFFSLAPTWQLQIYNHVYINFIIFGDPVSWCIGDDVVERIKLLKSGLWITGTLSKVYGWIFPKEQFVRIFIRLNISRSPSVSEKVKHDTRHMVFALLYDQVNIFSTNILSYSTCPGRLYKYI